MKNNKEKILVTVLFFIIIGASIFISYLVLCREDKKTDSPNTTTTQSISKDSTTTELITTPTTETTVTTTSTSISTKSSVSTSKTTKKSTKTKTTTNIADKIVSTKTTSNLIKQESKYGVLFKTYEVVTYSIYGDGREVETSRKEEVKYDHSGYDGTTVDLLAEAKTLVSTNNASYNEILNIVNRYRSEAGIQPLVMDAKLTQGATVRAMEMGYANKYSHTRPNGTEPFTVLGDLNITYSQAGENIAYGQKNPTSVCTDWFNSTGHRENMLNPNFTKIGIGYFKFNGKTYWVQLFI